MPIRGPSNSKTQGPIKVAGGPVSVTGPLTDAQLRATPVPVSGPLTDAQLRATPVPVSGIVTLTRPATSATTQVNDNASSVTLLASNANRLGASIAQDSSADLYVKLGATATLTDYSVRIPQHGYFEVPFGYTGIIDGIWASDPNDGAARMTEFTP